MQWAPGCISLYEAASTGLGYWSSGEACGTTSLTLLSGVEDGHQIRSLIYAVSPGVLPGRLATSRHKLVALGKQDASPLTLAVQPDHRARCDLIRGSRVHQEGKEGPLGLTQTLIQYYNQLI